ncbi:helix-turn-helix domain-containing protein [Marinitoga sp. 1155]|uniref:helix-turn-helix domain-containing protein n=1 Tax=Marinitoga sp. 1155 TaxID=1428448 RepID=UPI0012E05CD7|nr:helix-turn-helix transcriptional regulator [Marinitoga sp. 1155]
MNRKIKVIIMDSKFSQRIKNLRERKGLKQIKLVNMLNVGRSIVSSRELGKSKPNLEVIKQLSKIFDISVDFLLGINNKTTPIEDSKLTLKQIPVYGYVAANSEHGEIAYEELIILLYQMA